MCILIKRFEVGFKQLITNCYLVACEETLDAVVIDPGFREGQDEEILREISEQNLQVKYIANTHGHPDHTSGNETLKQATDAIILIYEKDAQWLTNPWTSFLEAMRGAGLNIEKPPFPCLKCGKDTLSWEYLENEEKAIIRCVDCGVIDEWRNSAPDLLLHHGDIIKVGKLELKVIHTPGHSEGTISLYCESENTIFARTEDIARTRELIELPDHTIVYPGHGERTTIGKAKRQ